MCYIVTCATFFIAAIVHMYCLMFPSSVCSILFVIILIEFQVSYLNYNSISYSLALGYDAKNGILFNSHSSLKRLSVFTAP